MPSNKRTSKTTKKTSTRKTKRSQPFLARITPTQKFITLIAFLAVFVAAGIFVISQSRASSPVAIKDTNYAIPAGSLFVSPSGSDAAAGTQSAPLQTLTKAIAKATSGQTIVLRAGSYRESIAGITKKLTLQPYPHEQVWMKGSDVVTGWTQSGSAWVHSGWTNQFCHTCFASTAVDSSAPLAGWPDQAFINGQPLTLVSSAAQVTAGKFFVDYAAKKLYVGTNPAGATLEASTRWRALQFDNATASGSIIRGLGFSQYSSHWNEDQLGMVIINAPNATLENDTFAYSAGTGFMVAQPGAKITGNTASYNGYRGANLNNAAGSVLQNNHFDNNNTKHFNITSCGSYCTEAGVKAAHSDGLTIKNNTFQNNYGSGFWCDLGCQNVDMIGNTVSGNANNGLYYEISSHAIIASNLIVGNGRGVKISGSDNVRLFNNTFARNAISLGLYDDPRVPSTTDSYSAARGLTWNDTGTIIRNNIFSNGDGSANPFFDTNSTAQVATPAMVNDMDHNAYYRTSSSSPATMFKWCPASGCVYYANVAAFSKATGHDNSGSSLAIDNQATNPFFVNDAGGNYALKSGSKALGAGAALPADVAAAIGVPASPVSLGALTLGNSTTPTTPTPKPTPSHTPAPTAIGIPATPNPTPSHTPAPTAIGIPATPNPTPLPPQPKGHGLSATYYSSTSFTGRSAARIDPNINFNWGAGAPEANFPADNFSARWLGDITAPTTATYTFYGTSDDGLRLWINNQLVLNDWSDHAARTTTGTFKLQAGKPVAFRVEYYEHTQSAKAIVEWSAPSLARQVIPTAAFQPVIGHGVIGEYFTYQTLATFTPVMSRVDPTINFNWGYAAPNLTMPVGHFGASWIGKIAPAKTDLYTFTTTTDDGVRLWIDGNLVIDNWTDHKATVNHSGAVTLVAGHTYDIVMDYYERNGVAISQLDWSSPTMTNTTVPESVLLQN